MEIIYEVRGAVIWGGGDREKVALAREVKRGDIFYANSHFYEVKMAGLYERQHYGHECTHFMVARDLGFVGEFDK